MSPRRMRWAVTAAVLAPLSCVFFLGRLSAQPGFRGGLPPFPPGPGGMIGNRNPGGILGNRGGFGGGTKKAATRVAALIVKVRYWLFVVMMGLSALAGAGVC